MTDSGWRFDKRNSMTIYFKKTGELNGSNYVKIPLQTNAILNIENIDKYCFILFMLASLHPCNNHPNRILNFKKYFNEVDIQGFDFTEGFKCSDVHRFNEINKLSFFIFKLVFYQDQNKGRHKLKPVEVSSKNSDRVIDFGIYKNHYFLIKKLDVFLGYHNKKFLFVDNV